MALAVQVMSEGSTNFQARATLKKTDTPAELMAQEMEQYEADKHSKEKRSDTGQK